MFESEPAILAAGVVRCVGPNGKRFTGIGLRREEKKWMVFLIYMCLILQFTIIKLKTLRPVFNYGRGSVSDINYIDKLQNIYITVLYSYLYSFSPFLIVYNIFIILFFYLSSLQILLHIFSLCFLLSL